MSGVYLIGYVSAIVGFLFILSFSGLGFDEALLTSVGAITNSGGLVHGDIASDHQHLTMIAAMLLGRWGDIGVAAGFCAGILAKIDCAFETASILYVRTCENASNTVAREKKEGNDNV